MIDDRQQFVIPVLTLNNAVVFPQMTLPISTDRPSAIASIEAALTKPDKTILVLSQKEASIDLPDPNNLFSVGTIATIKLLARSNDVMQVIVQGLERCEVLELDKANSYLKARVKLYPFTVERSDEQEALQLELIDIINKYLSLGHPELNITFPQFVSSKDDAMQLIFPLGQLFIRDHNQAQTLLESPSLMEAMKTMRSLLVHEIKILELRQKISKQTHEEMDREQHDYLLRKQLQQIQKELGEKNPMEAELLDLRKRFETLAMPDDIKKEVERELDRLGRLPPISSDYQVMVGHLELVLELPWSESTTDNLNLNNARQVLTEDHYGLEEINERIIEHLAVMKLNPAAKAPILCFVGPPGVGKTSLGQSIARALGRKFERFSLGGLHDEAELRGHRRTYIGAMPGRIIQGIRRSGVKNPLMMLDEIDKMGRDFRGDPAAALMEVLDPEQNCTFRDNYLDLPFDLSLVFFITTANTTETIPRPLLDRMEVLRLSGYYEEEKMQIAIKYLLPRQRKEAGLDAQQFSVPDETLMTVIRRYTREAGVRELERMLGRLARKAAVKFAEADTEPITVHLDDLVEMLGPERFFVEQLRKELPVGVATGLAWTETGGDVLYVEAIGLPQKDKFTLTGQLGEVMKESAMAANSYVRAHCKVIGIPQFKAPVHIHVPVGAIPKDGPSAGVTMAAALTSLYCNFPVRSDTAMTGEITLSGLVLPVGGIKEKLLAARRAGLRRVVLPKDNRKDLKNLPDYVVNDIEFVFVENIPETLATVIPQLRDLIRT